MSSQTTLLTREEGEAVLREVLGLSRADDVTVSLVASSTAHLRYAQNAPSTSGRHGDHVLSVESTFGKRSASATVNQLDPRTLAEVVSRSEQLARLAPENPEAMPALGPQEYPALAGHDERLLDGAAEQMVRGSALCIDRARALELTAAGYSEASDVATWVGNRRDLRGYHRHTGVSFSQTARTASGDGSGWAADVGNAAGAIDYQRCSEVSTAKARAAAHPRPLAPGKYVTILEPSCVASLVQLLAFSLNLRSAEEGRSFFAEPGGKTKLGQRLFPESVSLRSDPGAPLAPGAPWGSESLPQRPRRWIERGRLEQLYCERYWAERRGHEAVPPASNLLMDGGSGSLDELIADTPRGVLITSVFYIRLVDPRTLLFTGLTRDGVFWIEDGKISHPVTNFRWNESPIRVLQNVEALSASVRTAPRESLDMSMVVPALRVKEFELSSVSDAV